MNKAKNVSDNLQLTNGVNNFETNISGVEATKFASFIREQTNTNGHLNTYTKKVISETAGLNLTNLRMYKFDKLSKEEIVLILSKCVIQVTDEMIILNKPNGISVQDGKSQNISIVELLKDLSRVLHLKECLQVVHRLDKDTTGVLILAKNPEIAFKLREAFKKGQIRKNYLCLTHGLQTPREGIIDFMLKEKEVDGNVVIMPDMSYVKKSEQQKAKANTIRTAYKKLCSNYNIALVQCAMVSGVKHQVRAHLAFGLETPIIGDHKYSWLIKSTKFPILPQVLSEPALKGLKIEPGKVRHLPVYLHAHQIFIGDPPLNNGFDGKANLACPNRPIYPCHLPYYQAYANLPPFFVKTLQMLKLYNLKFLKGALKNIL